MSMSTVLVLRSFLYKIGTALILEKYHISHSEIPTVFLFFYFYSTRLLLRSFLYKIGTALILEKCLR